MPVTIKINPGAQTLNEVLYVSKERLEEMGKTLTARLPDYISTGDLLVLMKDIAKDDQEFAVMILHLSLKGV
jgi:hypothetical protein